VLRNVGVFECLAACVVHTLVFLLPVYALRAWMMAKGMPPVGPPPFIAGNGWYDWQPLNPLVPYDAYKNRAGKPTGLPVG